MPTERGTRRILTNELMKKVTVLESRCWFFNGAKDQDGFGIMRWDGKIRKAHQIFFELLCAPLNEGSKLIHHLPKDKCIGPSCCNPVHMKVWREGFPKPLARVKMCKKGHIIDESNKVTENRNGGIVARCRICRQEAWKEQKRQERATS